MIGMPVSGYLFSSFRGHGTTYFNLFSIPEPPANKQWAVVADWFHVATGQWLVYALIVLHLGGNSLARRGAARPGAGAHASVSGGVTPQRRAAF